MSITGSEANGHSNGNGLEKPYSGHNELTRTMTLALSPDQYERLFFQPSAAKGDLSKRLGNPTLLGVMGFLIPYTCVIFSILNFQGSSAGSITSFSGSFLFIGGIAMNIAGIFEFILGNTFPMCVFIIYGCHWVNLGYINDPAIGLAASYTAGDVPGALAQAYNAGQGNYNVVMALISFCFLCGSLRTNIPFVLVFFTLVFLFSFFAAAYYQLGFNPTPAGLAHAYYYFKIAGGFGFVAMIMGWYLTLITACAATGVPCPLPIFDLSAKVFAHNSDALKGEHAGADTAATRNA
jgi:succinate-acetate transporter protein